MDKSTLSNYGWIVIAVLVLSVMIALSTPFGKYVKEATESTVEGLFATEEKALNVMGLSALGGGDGKVQSPSKDENKDTIDLSTVDAVLENNSWETIQKVVKAGKVAEVGWSVGDTKTLTINGQEKEATIIGLNHDGENTATFMIMSDIGLHYMNNGNMNEGGWEASSMRTWLNDDVYNSMSNKACIKQVTKMSNNVGFRGTEASGTSDRLFLLSVREAGCRYPSNYSDYEEIFDLEGTKYEFFETNQLNSSNFWLRTRSMDESNFFYYKQGSLEIKDAYTEFIVMPAFVIG